MKKRYGNGDKKKKHIGDGQSIRIYKILHVGGKTKMKIFVFSKSTLLILLIAVFISVSLVPVSMSVSRNAGQGGKNLPIYSVETEEKKVALTFNCAWGDEDIDMILDTLSTYGAKCTFFIVGTWAEKYPKAVEKIKAAGHEIGSHGYDHGHYKKMTENEVKTDIEKAAEAIEKITGETCRLFRAPYGEYTDKTVTLVRDGGGEILQWNIDSLDYQGLTEKEMEGRILPRLENGAVILFHTGTENTARSLPYLLDSIKAKGYAFETVGNLLHKEPYTINHEGKQLRAKA